MLHALPASDWIRRWRPSHPRRGRSRPPPPPCREIVQWAATIHLLAEFVLVFYFRQMGMETNVELFRKRRGRAHQRRRRRKRRARRQRNLHHGVLAALMML